MFQPPWGSKRNKARGLAVVGSWYTRVVGLNSTNWRAPPCTTIHLSTASIPWKIYLDVGRISEVLGQRVLSFKT